MRGSCEAGQAVWAACTEVLQACAASPGMTRAAGAGVAAQTSPLWGEPPGCPPACPERRARARADGLAGDGGQPGRLARGAGHGRGGGAAERGPPRRNAQGRAPPPGRARRADCAHRRFRCARPAASAAGPALAAATHAGTRSVSAKPTLCPAAGTAVKRKPAKCWACKRAACGSLWEPECLALQLHRAGRLDQVRSMTSTHVSCAASQHWCRLVKRGR